MGMQKDGGLVARAVREALGTLVSPEMYGQLVARALRAARIEAIPESGREVKTFLEGPLRREIEQAVGDDAAELVAAQLAPIAAHAASIQSAPEPRTSFGSDKPTGLVTAPEPAPSRREDLARTARLKLSPEQLAALRRPPPGKDDEAGNTTRPQASDEPIEGAQRRVLAATADASALTALRQAVHKRAHVIAIPDLVGLLDALDAPDLYEPVVLVDCRKPTVHVTSVVAIGEDLPRGTTCVLWGASEETWRELERGHQPCRWVRCSQEATTSDVGSLCAMLLG